MEERQNNDTLWATDENGKTLEKSLQVWETVYNRPQFWHIM